MLNMTKVSFHCRNIIHVASQDESALVKALENPTCESIILRKKTTTPRNDSYENKLRETRDNSFLKCGSTISVTRPPKRQMNMRQNYKK